MTSIHYSSRLVWTALAAVFLASVSVQAAAINRANFQKRCAVSLTGYTGESVLENFPVLVRLSAGSPVGFDYIDCADGGSDLRFADAEGNLLSHEIDTWDPDGESLVWVRIPRLSAGTRLTLYYGAREDATLEDVNPSEVWSAGAYRGVWHFSGDEKESVHGLEATVSGTPDYSAGGAVGRCYSAAEDKTYLLYANDERWSRFGEDGTLTVSGWFKLDGKPMYQRFVSTKVNNNSGNRGWELTAFTAANQVALVASEGTGSNRTIVDASKDLTAELVYLAMVFRADQTVHLFVNGVEEAAYSQGNGSFASLLEPTDPLALGARAAQDWPLVGKMDEVRLHATAESAEYVAAAYATMTQADFATFGEVEEVVVGTPAFSGAVGFEWIGPNELNLFVPIETIGENAGIASLYFNHAGTEVAIGTTSTSGVQTFTVRNLDPLATYENATVRIENDLGASVQSAPFTTSYPQEPKLTDFAAQSLDNGDVLFTVTLANIGYLSTSATATISYGTSETTETVKEVLSFTEAGTQTFTLAAGTDLTPSTVYTAQLTVTDSEGRATTSAPLTFTSLGAASIDPTPTVTLDATTATFAATVTVLGAGANTVTLRYGCGTDETTAKANMTSVNSYTITKAGEVTFTLDGLVPGSTIAYAITIENICGEETYSSTTDTATLAIEDPSTYTWKSGSKGFWNDPSNWTCSAEGTLGYPTKNSSVLFPDGYCEVILPANVTVSNLTFTPSGTCILRANTYYPDSRREIACSALASAGGTGGTLVLDNVRSMGKQMVVGWSTIKLIHNAQCYTGDDENLTVELESFGFYSETWNANNTLGPLKVRGGLNIVCDNANDSRTFSFASFEDGGDIATVSCIDGKVSFRDPSGIERIGGSDSYEAPGPQIPVAPNFILTSTYLNHHLKTGFGAATVDANGVIRQIPASSMLQSFEGATELDNVYVPSTGLTLDRDITVNCVVYDGDLDLGGYKLTVKSGVIRPNSRNSYKYVKNGTVCLGRPGIIPDDGNNTTCRFLANLVFDWNDDPLRPVVQYVTPLGAYPNAIDYSTFTGRLFEPGLTIKHGEYNAPNAVFDCGLDRGFVNNGHYNQSRIRGLVGSGTVRLDGFFQALWLGDLTEEDAAVLQTNQNSPYKWSVVATNQAVLVPGVRSWDGGNRGSMVFRWVKERLNSLLIKSGATLECHLHPDGEASFIEASTTDAAGSYTTVTLGGRLVLKPIGKLPDDGEWVVVRTMKATTGRFDSVSNGYRVEYNVPQPDGTLAAVVTKAAQPTLLFIY